MAGSVTCSRLPKEKIVLVVEWIADKLPLIGLANGKLMVAVSQVKRDARKIIPQHGAGSALLFELG